MLELLLSSKKAAGGGGNTYLGEIAGADFITGPDLVTAVGVTQGSPTSGVNTSWLKFLYNGRTLYLAKTPIRKGMYYTHIDSLGALTGSKTVVINGKTYSVKCLTGGNAVPATAAGGEWNDLIYPVCNQGPKANQFASFTPAQLGLTAAGSDGGVNICRDASSSGGVVARGYPDPVTGYWYLPSNDTNANYGWRPLLEEIP